jgi:hypothetical protein
MKSIVTQCAQAGWHLFPARYDPETHQHRGLIKWGTESSNDPLTIKSWAEKWPDAYFCVNLSASNLCVVDVDVKKDKQGDVTLIGLEIDYGPLPPTFTISTPSGGRHHYFTGAVKASVEKLGPGIDTPVMVPLPGQDVPGKGAYTVTDNRPLAPAPEWIGRIVGQKTEHEDRKQTPAVDWDLPTNIADAAIYAQTAPPAREGDGGDRRTYTVACHIRDFAVSESTCLDLMSHYYNPRCQPPWPIDELQTKIRNAYQYAVSQAGETLPAADFEPVVVKTEGVYCLADFQGPAPERKWVVEGWMPERELTSLYGKPGGGKSLIALQLSHAIATGTPWLGLATQKMPVLIVSCEDCADEMHRRVDCIKADPAYVFSDDPASIQWYGWPRVGRDNIIARTHENKIVKGPFADELEAQIKQMPPGPKVIMLDTLADVYAGNESDRSMVNAFLKSCLGRLRTEYDATILVIGHPAKSSESEYSGSTAWDGGVRSRWILSRHENDNLSDHRVLVRAKSNYGQVGERIVLQWIDGVFQAVKEESIQDPIFETNCNILMNHIVTQAKTGTPYSKSKLGKMCIYDNPGIRDQYGHRMTRDIINQCLIQLQTEGVVELVTGRKHNNGIWPA